MRRALHGKRRPHAPLPAHADSVQNSQYQEHGVVDGESAEDFDDGEEDHVDHERYAATVAVGRQSEEQSAQRTRRERGSDGGYNQRFGNMELSGQYVVEEDDHKEVESIQGPAQKTGGHRVKAV